jgi:hypothetical protein
MIPPRLSSTTRDGLERDLLSSAASDRAPEATRERVREAVARALASAAASPLASAGASGSLPDSGGGPGAAPPARGVGRLGGERAALCLGALALAASVALVIRHGVEQRQPTPRSGITAVPPGGSALLQGGSSLSQGGSATAQRPLANTTAVAPRFVSAGELLQSPADDAPDWLGAQLQLLGEARRQLDAGALQQTRGLLDSYEQRFPDGVLGPQMAALRAELLRQEAQQSSAGLNRHAP